MYPMPASLVLSSLDIAPVATDLECDTPEPFPETLATPPADIAWNEETWAIWHGHYPQER